MRLGIRSKKTSYAIIFAVNIFALLLSLVFSSRTAIDPFLLFVPAVAVTAWYAGIVAGFLSILFAILASDYFLLPPLYTINLMADDLPRIAIFIIVAVVINWIGGSRKQIDGGRKRMETIVDSSEDAIIGINFDGTIFSWNKGAETIYGYSAQEISGRSITTLLLPGDLAAVTAVLEQVRQRKPISPYKAMHVRKDGGLVDILVVSVSPVPVRNHGGERSGSYWIIRDLSQQKRTREQLDILSNAVENTSDIVIITDRQGLIEYVNPAFQTITGYSKEEVNGQTPRLIKSGKQPPEFYQRLWNTLLSGNVFHAEMINRKKNGDLYYELKTITPIKDDQGNITAFVSTGNDITERALAGETLKQEVEERTRELSALYDITAIASNSIDLSALLDRSLARIMLAMDACGGQVHLLNEASGALEVFLTRGFVSTEIVSMFNTMPDVWRSGEVAQRGKPLAITDLSTHSPGEGSALPDPDAAGWAFAGVPIMTENRVVGLLCVTREKTRPFVANEVALLVSISEHLGIAVERIHLFEEAQSNAVSLERERLAHELHDSLTQNVYSVSLLAEAARRFMTVGEAHTAIHYLGRIGELSQQSLKEMRLLVYELRPLALADSNLIEALNQRLDAVERRAGIDARFLYNDKMKLSAVVEDALYRVAQEALNNSLTHAAASSVTVTIHAEDKSVELRVEDNGKGFDPSASRSGAGLGLDSMRRRVERLGGRFEVISKPGEGTRVTADVPLQ